MRTQLHLVPTTNKAETTRNLLLDQLESTVDVMALLERVRHHSIGNHREFSNLLEAIHREMDLMSELINHRTGVNRLNTDNSQRHTAATDAIDVDGTSTLLNALCIYAKHTSFRRIDATKYGDSAAVNLLDSILQCANQSIWFLDMYRNAIALKSPLAKLPAWTCSVEVGRDARCGSR